MKTHKLIEKLTTEPCVNLRVFSLRVDSSEAASFDKYSDDDIGRDVYEEILSCSKYRPNFYNLLKSYISRVPLSVYRNSVYPTERLDSWLNWCDIVIVDHFFMFQYIPPRFNKKVILHEHNAEYILWTRRAETEKNFLKKVLLYMEAKRVRCYESEICSRASAVLASPNDIQELSKLEIDKEKFFLTYHLGDDSMLHDTKNSADILVDDNKVTFLGDFGWDPNYDGILWFLEYVWGKVLVEKPDAVLHLVGNCNESQRSVFRRYTNVFIHGFVENVGDVLLGSRCFISPLRYGSGMKVKNITALYCGLPIVTTSVGAEGIDLEHGINAFICDDSDEFASQVLKVMSCKIIYETVKSRAVLLAESKYSWNSNLDKFIQDVLRVYNER